MNALIQLQIWAPKTRATELTDALLNYQSAETADAALVFSTSSMGYYPLDSSDLSTAEQVLGYQNVQWFLVSLAAVELQNLFDYLRQTLGQTGFEYQVMPVIDKGYL